MRRCASGSEISLRTHSASMSRHSGGANRSQISSPTSFCVTVPSKSNTRVKPEGSGIPMF